MSLLGAPSLSGLGQAGPQMIQLPCSTVRTAQTTHWLPSLGPGDTYRAQKMSGQTELRLCQDILKAKVARRGTEPEWRPEGAVSARQDSQSLGPEASGISQMQL